MNQSRLVCYIDEAGCSGGKFGKGSSHFLTFGAVVYDRADEAGILALFDEARTIRGHRKTFNKFSDASTQDNFVLTQLLAQKRVRIAQVALHKPSMAGSFTRSHHKEEFQYLCKFILERVSWIARDSAHARNMPDTKCEIIFSEQKMYPYEDLQGYLHKLKSGRDRYNARIDWRYLLDTVSCTPHVNEAPTHLSDIAASSLQMAIEPKLHGITDDRFIRNLAPALYRKVRQLYGVKLFPTREISEMTEQGDFSFLKLL